MDSRHVMLQFSDVSITWYVLNNLVQYAELCSLARVRSNYLFLEVVRTIISVIEETKVCAFVVQVNQNSGERIN